MDTEASFLKERMTGIGGSDIAAILGLSPWKTPLQVWFEKTGSSQDLPDERSRERMHWGLQLEDVVARHYARSMASGFSASTRC